MTAVPLISHHLMQPTRWAHSLAVFRRCQTRQSIADRPCSPSWKQPQPARIVWLDIHKHFTLALPLLHRCQTRWSRRLTIPSWLAMYASRILRPPTLSPVGPSIQSGMQHSSYISSSVSLFRTRALAFSHHTTTLSSRFVSFFSFFFFFFPWDRVPRASFEQRAAADAHPEAPGNASCQHQFVAGNFICNSLFLLSCTLQSPYFISGGVYSSRVDFILNLYLFAPFKYNSIH